MSQYRPSSKTTSSSPSIDDFLRPKLNLFRNVYGVNNIAKTSLNFSQRLFEEECKRRTSHFAFSPVSILLFFSEIAFGGAQGGTKEQILQVFRLYPRFVRNSDTLHELLSSFHKILQTHDNSVPRKSKQKKQNKKKKKKKIEKGHVLQWNDFCFINLRNRTGLSSQFKKIREKYFPSLEFRFFKPRFNNNNNNKSESKKTLSPAAAATTTTPRTPRTTGEEEEVRMFKEGISQLNDFIKTLTYGKVQKCLNPSTFKCREFFITDDPKDGNNNNPNTRVPSRGGGNRSNTSNTRNMKKGDILMIQTIFCSLKWKVPFQKVIKRQRFFTLSDAPRRSSVNPSTSEPKKKINSGRSDKKDDEKSSDNDSLPPQPNSHAQESTNCFIDMMVKKNAACFYGVHSWKENEVVFDFTSIVLPFHSSSYSLLILLPENKGIKQMNLIQDVLVNKIFKERDLFLKLKREQKVTKIRKLMIPRFTISYSKSYKNLLEDLGLKLPFSDIEADFFNLTNNNMRIIDVVQSLEIRFEENGLESENAKKKRIQRQQEEEALNRKKISMKKKKGSKSDGLTVGGGGPKGKGSSGGRADGHSVIHGKLEDTEIDFVVNRPFFGLMMCTRINFPLVYMKVSHPQYVSFKSDEDDSDEEENEGEN